ncbi:RluA family pseudouridine synthase [Permianibacter aggregans]|uniref:tRNA pseudouridine32 synthase/23S rRNA pseudouridine746 synthase n=1 Tax=Permianibacter aggregans TaxID=1510150 RepID=A0A4R6V162_9GAMM|nr:RluA family pseudouridine synthase [Permianibacter aggregans]TDQ49754.1 tRNA pseudouridine32 synthase/23S rRNA pseudouridine746 synthase [Permianibacter aggregans]
MKPDWQLTHQGEPMAAIDALAAISQLPKARLKDAMNKGAVWLKRGKKMQRLRRATFMLQVGDHLQLFYNADLLARTAPASTLFADEKAYSVWYKPAGVLAQGNEYGDHCALLRQAEQQLQRQVFLVHRLDREAEGLMLIAHTGKAAAQLSNLFQQQQIEKYYRIEVRGELPEQGTFERKLDGKPAKTIYQRLQFDSQLNRSIVDVRIEHGRKHQIRRHFADAGFPILGDPRYGQNNADPRGMQLVAYRLKFVCPLTKKSRDYHWPLPSANQD